MSNDRPCAKRHGILSRKLTADTSYGPRYFLVRDEKRGIEANIPLTASRTGTRERPPNAAFDDEAASVTWTCAHGTILRQWVDPISRDITTRCPAGRRTVSESRARSAAMQADRLRPR
jgi:hypothetical protein